MNVFALFVLIILSSASAQDTKNRIQGFEDPCDDKAPANLPTGVNSIAEKIVDWSIEQQRKCRQMGLKPELCYHIDDLKSMAVAIGAMEWTDLDQSVVDQVTSEQKKYLFKKVQDLQVLRSIDALEKDDRSVVVHEARLLWHRVADYRETCTHLFNRFQQALGNRDLKDSQLTYCRDIEVRDDKGYDQDAKSFIVHVAQKAFTWCKDKEQGCNEPRDAESMCHLVKEDMKFVWDGKERHLIGLAFPPRDEHWSVDQCYWALVHFQNFKVADVHAKLIDNAPASWFEASQLYAVLVDEYNNQCPEHFKRFRDAIEGILYWQFCAQENQVCEPITYLKCIHVRYGSGKDWISKSTKTPSGKFPSTCSSKFYGDPYPKQTKECHCGAFNERYSRSKRIPLSGTSVADSSAIYV